MIDHLVVDHEHPQLGSRVRASRRRWRCVFLIASVVVVDRPRRLRRAHPQATSRTDAVLGLILGGTVGNGFDRIMFGTVTDFINVHFWPVFNVADSAISIGVVAARSPGTCYASRAAA